STSRSFNSYLALQVLHSFPTRRSSDLYRARGYHDGGPEVDVDAIVVRGNVLTADARIPTASGGTETRRLEVEIRGDRMAGRLRADRKSTRLNSSHVKISYAVFCLKKKK